MNRIILADNQSIFRAGAARVLASEDDMRIVAQCSTTEALFSAVQAFRNSITLFATSLQPDLHAALECLIPAGSKSVLITENHEQIPLDVLAHLSGVLQRGITGQELVQCVRQVGEGKRSVRLPDRDTANSATDLVGTRVRDRLTPREMQIVGLIVQGCKNKEIAQRLGVTEQVVKNYLRSVYDKSGVSDRLELALFTIHHRILAEAAHKAGVHFTAMPARQSA
jgi:DNA-binding NarL/FixJ family response regulator